MGRLLQAAIAEFLFYCSVERKFSDNTIEAYKRDLRQFSLVCGSSDLKKALSISTLKRFLEVTLVEKKLSVSTARRRMACIRAFAQYAAVEFGVGNPFLSWSPSLKRPKRLPRALTSAELHSLVGPQESQSEIDGETIFCVLLLGATGLRVSELCSVTPSDIDASGASIRVRGKGSRDRIVYVSDTMLQSELKQRRTLAFSHSLQSAPLLVNSRGRQLKPQTLRRRLHKLRENQGLDRTVTPHILRHTAATLLIEGGTDIRFVQRLLGHASISTTEIYTHVNDTALKRAIMKANVIGTVLTR